MAAKNNKKKDPNLEALKTSRLPLATLTAEEREAVASLTPEEVRAIVSARGKLGDTLIRKHVPHGMMF
jgi:hypothetical protein